MVGEITHAGQRYTDITYIKIYRAINQILMPGYSASNQQWMFSYTEHNKPVTTAIVDIGGDMDVDTKLAGFADSGPLLGQHVNVNVLFNGLSVVKEKWEMECSGLKMDINLHSTYI